MNSAPVRPDAGVVAEAGVVVPVGRVGEGALQSGGREKIQHIFVLRRFIYHALNCI